MKIIVRDYPSTFYLDMGLEKSYQAEYKESGVACFFKLFDIVIKKTEDIMIREFYR